MLTPPFIPSEKQEFPMVVLLVLVIMGEKC